MDGPASAAAIELTFRSSHEIRLEEELAGQIECATNLVKDLFPEFRSAKPLIRFQPSEILLRLKSGFGPMLDNGTVAEPASALGQFLSTLPVKQSRQLPISSNLFMLEFNEPLNGYELAKQLRSLQEVSDASPNFLVLNGPDLGIGHKGNHYYVVVKTCSQDGRIQCSSEMFTYFVVNEAMTEVVRVGHLGSIERPLVPLWNIPPAYPATAFKDADQLFETLQSSPFWWVRLHAAEVVGQLLVLDSPSTAVDWDRQSGQHTAYDSLRAQVLARQPQALSILSSAAEDSDEDAQKSARTWLGEMDITQNQDWREVVDLGFRSLGQIALARAFRGSGKGKTATGAYEIRVTKDRFLGDCPAETLLATDFQINLGLSLEEAELYVRKRLEGCSGDCGSGSLEIVQQGGQIILKAVADDDEDAYGGVEANGTFFVTIPDHVEFDSPANSHITQWRGEIADGRIKGSARSRLHRDLEHAFIEQCDRTQGVCIAKLLPPIDCTALVEFEGKVK
ncbi:MAG: hypothetical protein HYT87_02025 [Nitrospirae bacterium]|nr:hypothetical protein [Nitrospirota bacterium]